MSACSLSNPLMMPSHRAVIARGPGMVTSTVIVSLSPGVTVNSCAAPVAGTARVWPFTVTVYDSAGGRGASLLMTGSLGPPSVSGIATADATATAETAAMIPARVRRPRLTRRTRGPGLRRSSAAGLPAPPSRPGASAVSARRSASPCSLPYPLSAFDSCTATWDIASLTYRLTVPSATPSTAATSATGRSS
jgi:hypothetical protein